MFSNSFLETSIFKGPFGLSTISETFSLEDKSFLIFSATLSKDLSSSSKLEFFDFLYFLANNLIISLSKSCPPSSLSPTEVITSTFLFLTAAIVISNVPPPKSKIKTLPLTDVPGKLA